MSGEALLDCAQMGIADQLAVASGVPVEELMRNAGAAVARAIIARWSPRPTLVLCGPGNNGGDGFVAARELAAAGWPVRVAMRGDRDHLTGAARVHAMRWQGPVESLAGSAVPGDTAPGAMATVLGDAALVVDAVFGAGFHGEFTGPAREVLAAAEAAGVPLVAVDVPSGVSGDTGGAAGAVAATLTVTFFRKKPGHLLLPGRTLCGELRVVDIGIPVAVLETIAPRCFENTPALWLPALPQRRPDDHKFTRGHALVIGGYPLTGAGRLAARAAARAGAGLTTVAVPPEAWSVYAASLISVMVRTVESAADFGVLVADPRITAMLIGPGAGVSAWTRSRVAVLLASGRAVVLDADALTAFAGEAETLFRQIQGPCVMTPHAGEFERLFGAGAGQAATDKLARARAAAKRSGAVIILKGADTVVAAPDGRACINANAPPWLATAGAGDVLAGILVGLLAQGMEAFAAAAAAVWLHGAAAADFGPGLIGEDLPESVPAVLRQLVAGMGQLHP